jgi:hypothetical protein
MKAVPSPATRTHLIVLQPIAAAVAADSPNIPILDTRMADLRAV